MIEDLRRPIRLRCVWCKQVGRHHPVCQEQLDEWSRMRWGKHKGERIENVETDYLERVLRFRFGSQEDRRQFLDVLLTRDTERYRHPQWQQFVDGPAD